MLGTTNLHDLWRDKWWLEDEYALVYGERFSREEVDEAISAVAEVFDQKWADRTPLHPAYYPLLSRGLFPLQFLYSLGSEIIALEGSQRFRSVVDGLRHPDQYESARFELEIAAHLKSNGHEIEFRPPVPNGKEADFIARFGSEVVYFEIKRFQESQIQLALNWLSQDITVMVSNLTSASGVESLKGSGYQIDFDAAVSLLLGNGPENDRDLIEGFRQKVENEIRERAQSSGSLDFSIPGIATVRIGNLPLEGSSINCPIVNSVSELRRIVGGRLKGAIEQLHPEFPGLIIVQTPGGLELDLTQAVLEALLLQLGHRARHLSGVAFFPVFYSFPTTWAYFQPFAVANRTATLQANSLRAFTNLRKLLEVQVQVPE